MSSLARRMAPAVVLTGSALTLVALFDPAVSALAGAGTTSAASGGTTAGPVQVAAKVVDGRVCEAVAVVWPDGDRKSAFINQEALPTINERASADGVAFDAVSGATVTSEGYRASLQALLDSLK